MPMKYLAIDFEYNQANEPHMGLISCDLCREDGQHLSLWLKDSLVEREKLCNVLRKANDQGYTLVAHNAVAEASCLIALGLNPREFQWADTFLEYHQLQNNNNDFQYGWLISGEGPFARWIKSKPPIPRSALLESDETFGSDREKMIARFNKDGHSCEKVNPSLVHALKNILGIEADAQMKEDTRGLILERKAVYSHEEQERILAYGGTDTQHLIPLARKMRELVGGRLAKALGSRFTEDALTQAILWRGRAAANVAVYTMAGMPVDRSRWLNLAASKAAALRQAIQEFQARWCNLWEWDPREQKFKAKTSLKNGMAERIAKEHGIKWQKTGSGDFSFSTADGMPLQAYRDLIPELKDYCRLVELESGLKAHASAEEMAQEEEAGLGKKKKRRFADFFGSDNIVRPWYGPYGTQTGRNAPSATGFIPAQAGWLRGLINPPEGWEISEADFSSQESFIAAALSGDKKLMAAYTGGDPYLAFAISAGAAPAGATKKTHGDVRQLFKATVLGLQYGMGAAKLAVKLTADTGKKVSEDQARELIQMHREVYSQYYSWKDGVWARYRDGSKPMLLADGWYLDTDCTSKMSALNFPVQGGGSAMMRHFIDILLDKGVRVVCPVHDSVIYMSEVGDTATHSVVAGAMIEASRRVLGVEGMRVGAPDTLRHGEFWETEKNAETLSRFKKFFEPKEELEGGWLARVCAEE